MVVYPFTQPQSSLPNMEQHSCFVANGDREHTALGAESGTRRINRHVCASNLACPNKVVVEVAVVVDWISFFPLSCCIYKCRNHNLRFQ